MIGQHFGRYEVLSRLGQGGLATVWKAHDHLLGRAVALKILDEKLGADDKTRRRFLSEARIMAALDHPGIVAVHDFGEDAGRAFIAIGLIEGETVSARVARRLLPISECVRIAIEAAEALGHAHEHRVIHRDVTSRNIMVGADGRVFVLDFGLALAAWESRLTSLHTAMGTMPYMSPEVIQGGQATIASDVYGLGVVLYEVLTGALPFEGEHPEAVRYRVLNEAPAPLRERRPEVSEALEALVMRALDHDPARRPADMRTLGAGLATLTGSAQVVSLPPGPADRIPRTAPVAAVDGAWPQPLYLAIPRFRSGGAPASPHEPAVGNLAATLSAALASENDLHVVPVPERELRDDEDAIGIAREAGANALLLGKTFVSGSQTRVTYVVRDPWRGVEIAGGVVDGSVFELFELEDRVVASVRKALRLPSRGMPVPHLSIDPAAEERLALALAYLKRRDSLASVEGAITILEHLAASAGQRSKHHATLSRALLIKSVLTRERSWEIRAATCCQEALDLDDSEPMAHVARGELLLAGGRAEDALAEFSIALRSGEDYDALVGLGSSLSMMRENARAEASFQRAIELRPDDWRAYKALGELRFHADDFAGALESWRRVVELTPDNPIGRRDLGSALHRLDRFEEALAEYRASLAIQPNAIAFTNLGTTLYYLGRTEEAIDAFRKAAQLGPNNPKMWGNFGNAARATPGHETEGLAAIDRAIALMLASLDHNPSDSEGWARIAGYYENRGLHDEATAAITRALEIAPEDASCLVHAAHISIRMGDRDRCLHLLERAVRHGYGVRELEGDPDFVSLQSDASFQRLIVRDSRTPKP